MKPQSTDLESAMDRGSFRDDSKMPSSNFKKASSPPATAAALSSSKQDPTSSVIRQKQAPSTTSSSTPADNSATRSSSSFRRFAATALIAMLALASLRPVYRSYSSTLWNSLGLTALNGSSVRHASSSTTNDDVRSAVRLTSSEARYKLPSGDHIPAVALGTWKAGRGEVGAAVTAALKAGYRHIDGAWAYGNEAEIGSAIKQSGVPREDIWLTSKLWNTFHAPEDIEPVLDEALKKLQTSYLDLYLIHWPVAQNKITEEIDFDLTENPLPTWKKLEELVDKGKIRNIGVSNFNIRRLTNLTSGDIKYRPAVNQVELSWFNPQPKLLSWSKENNILIEAYSPLGSSSQVRKGLEVPEVKEVAEELGITPAQVILSWLHQRGVVVLPKSVKDARIKENFEVFKLPKAAFDKIDKSATDHPQWRIIDPSRGWGIDIFEDDKE